MAEIQVIRTDPQSGEKSVGIMPEENVAADTSGQFEVATPEKLEAYRKANTVTAGEAVQTGVEGFGRGVSVGLTDVAAGAISPEYAESMQERREKSPILAGGTEVLGTILPALAAPLAGGVKALATRGAAEAAEVGLGAAARAGVAEAAEAGLGTAVKAAGTTAVESAAKTGAAKALELGGKALAATPAGLVARGSEAVAHGLVKGQGILSGAARSAISGGIEGAAYGAGAEISEAALTDNYDQLAERLVAGGGDGALLGSALGGGFGLATNAFGRLIGSRRLGEALSETADQQILRDFGIRGPAYRKLSPVERASLIDDLKSSGALEQVGRGTPEQRLEFAQERLKDPEAKVRATADRFSETSAADIKKDFGISKRQFRGLTTRQQENLIGDLKRTGALDNARALSPDERLAYAEQRLDTHGPAIGTYVDELDNPRGLLREGDQLELRSQLDDLATGYERKGPFGRKAADTIREETKRLVDEGLTVEKLDEAAARLLAKDAPAFTDAAKVLRSKLDNAGGVHLDDSLPLFKRLYGVADNLKEQPGIEAKRIARKIRAEIDDVASKIKRNPDGSIQNDLTFRYLKQAESRYGGYGRDAANRQLPAAQRELAQAYNAVANELRDFTGDALEKRLGQKGRDAYRLHKKEYEVAKIIQRGADEQRLDLHYRPRVAEQTTDDVLKNLGKIPEPELRARLGEDGFREFQDATKQYRLNRLIEKGALDQQTAEATRNALSFTDKLGAQGGGTATAILGGVLTGNPLAAIPSYIGGQLAGIAANKALGYAGERLRRVIIDLGHQQAVVKQRIQHSLTTFLRAGRTGTAKLSVDINRALGVRANETPEDAYYRIADRLERQKAKDPGERYAGMREHTPETAAALARLDKRALDYVGSHFTTRVSSGNPMLDRAMRRVPPTDDQIYDAALALKTVKQPLSVLRSLKRGTLTLKESDALKNVYPELWNDVRSEAMRQLSRSTDDLPYNDRVRLGILLDIEVEPSTRPDAIALYQSFYNKPEPEGPAPSGGESGATRLPIPGKSIQSRVEQIESGAFEVG